MCPRELDLREEACVRKWMLRQPPQRAVAVQSEHLEHATHASQERVISHAKHGFEYGFTCANDTGQAVRRECKHFQNAARTLEMVHTLHGAVWVRETT